MPSWSVPAKFQTIALTLLLCAGCGQRPAAPPAAPAPTPAPAPAAAPAAVHVTKYTYEIVNTYPHDRGAFTEGLLFLNGKLLESTGMKGESSLREVELTNGQVIRQFDLPAASFGEGLAVLDGKAYQLTWQEQKCFVYDEPTFNLTNEFTYTGEGWGLTTDGKSLIMSDGTPQIRFIDPATFKVQRTIDVSVDGNPVKWVNELEYIKGEIFANVWQTPYVIRIDPASGAVTGVIDFTGLLSPADADATTDVFNGIAYDAAGDRIFVTGKRWPKLFEVRLKAVP